MFPFCTGAPELYPLLPPSILSLRADRRPLLPCVAIQTMYDTALVSWQRDGDLISSPASGLNTIRVEGGGVYTCTLTNNFTSISASITLLAVGVLVCEAVYCVRLCIE